MIGIYKIESPSLRIYIGQSVNIEKRWAWYNSLKSVKSQKKLYRSFLKYGVDKHEFTILHELPADVTKEVLTTYENIYIDQYGDAGHSLLNITAAKESRYGIRLTKEQKEHLSRVNMGKKLSHATLAKLKGKSAWNKGVKNPNPHWRGRNHSNETKEKIRKSLTGKRLSIESIAKRTATLKLNGVKRRWSVEAKQRQSQKYSGKKKSDETILKGRYTRGIKNWFHYGF